MADIPTGVLKETGLGQKGFLKEPVITFINELLDQNDELKEKVKKYESDEEEHESELIKQYREDQENAEKRAKEAEQKAEEAEKKAEEVGKNAEVTATQLQEANEKVELLANALKEAQDKSGEDTEKVKQLLEEKKQEISQLEENLQKITAEKESLESSLNEAKEQLASVTGDLNEMEGQMFAKDSQIEDLREELEELQSGASSEEELLEMQEQIATYEQQLQALQRENSDLERKASRTDVSVAYARAGRIIDDAESDAREIRNQAEADAFERLQTVQEEAARILNDADEKALSAKAQTEELVDAAMTDARLRSEEITRGAVEQEERVRQLTTFTRDVLKEQLSVLTEQMYTVRSLMEHTMNAVSETIDSADEAVYQAKMQIQDVSGIWDEQSEAIMSGQPYSAEPIYQEDMVEDVQEASYPEETTFTPEYNEEIPEVVNVMPPADDETVAETIMEVAAEGMQEVEVPKFEAPPKYQEPKFDTLPENISQENFAESMMNDFVTAPSLEDNLKIPEKDAEKFTMNGLMNDAEDATE